jgi:hypothetical protein
MAFVTLPLAALCTAGVTYGLSHLTSLTLAFRPELLQQLVQVAVDMPELRMLVLDSEESVAQVCESH